MSRLQYHQPRGPNPEGDQGQILFQKAQTYHQAVMPVFWQTINECDSDLFL